MQQVRSLSVQSYVQLIEISSSLIQQQSRQQLCSMQSYNNQQFIITHFPSRSIFLRKWFGLLLVCQVFTLFWDLFFHGHKSSSLQNTLLPLRSSQSIAILWWQGPWYTCSTTQTILNRLWEFWQLWLPPFPKWPRAKLTEIVLLFTTTLSFSLINEMCLMC